MSTGASREAPVDNGCSSTVLTTRNPGIPAIGILVRLWRLSLRALATNALFSSILTAADSPRMACISLGLLLGGLCGGSIYTTSKQLSNASVVWKKRWEHYEILWQFFEVQCKYMKCNMYTTGAPYVHTCCTICTHLLYHMYTTCAPYVHTRCAICILCTICTHLRNHMYTTGAPYVHHRCAICTTCCTICTLLSSLISPPPSIRCASIPAQPVPWTFLATRNLRATYAQNQLG